MKTLSEIKSVLLAEKPLLKERYGVKELGIFGSYTRNENRTDSDLDILVDFYPEFPMTLLKFINMENYLQDKLKTKSDVKINVTFFILLLFHGILNNFAIFQYILAYLKEFLNQTV